MKKIILLFSILLVSFFCNAQVPTYSLNDDFNWHFDMKVTDFNTVDEVIFNINDTSNFQLFTDTFEFGGQKITQQIISNWNTAFSFGNHATVGYSTASNTQIFTNKSGNISQWTNDVNYLTVETDGSTSNELQTLGGSNRVVTLSNGGGSRTIPLTHWDSIPGKPSFFSGVFIDLISKPTTISGYGITDPIVLTSGSYSNPSWITSISKSKITFSGSAANYVAADGSEIPFPDIDVIPIGTVISGIWASAPDGYLLLRGGTIGDASSGATVFANALMQDLFQLLWASFADSEAPVSGGRGASAAADWAAHKTIQLPDVRGRFVLGKATSGTGTTLGGVGGQLDMVYSINPPNTATDTEPDHNHGGVTGAPSGTSAQLVGVINVASATHTHSISNGGEHNHDVDISAFNTSANTPAFISLNYAIKY